MRTFSCRQAHTQFVREQSLLPQGFACSTAKLDFTSPVKDEVLHMQMGLIAADGPAPQCALLTTANAFVGAPVSVARQHVVQDTPRAVLFNNKIANVAATDGLVHCLKLCHQTAQALHLTTTQILPASTGVIGWPLPIKQMQAQIAPLVHNLQTHTAYDAACAMMTTDLYPKARTAQIGDVRITAIAKGAGMICPNMATLLVFIMTDAALAPDACRIMLRRAVDTSFNQISIDSDQSTSDMAVLLSSGCCQPPAPEIFFTALEQLCQELADDVVRNGEGVHHVMRIKVEQAVSACSAQRIARCVAHSPLWQCAVCGNDPNIGRLLMAIGKQASAQDKLNMEKLTIHIGPLCVFKQGSFVDQQRVETELAQYFTSCALYHSNAPDACGRFTPPVDYPPHTRTLEVRICLGAGEHKASILCADRSHEYITENTDYRS